MGGVRCAPSKICHRPSAELGLGRGAATREQACLHVGVGGKGWQVQAELRCWSPRRLWKDAGGLISLGRQWAAERLAEAGAVRRLWGPGGGGEDSLDPVGWRLRGTDKEEQRGDTMHKASIQQNATAVADGATRQTAMGAHAGVCVCSCRCTCMCVLTHMCARAHKCICACADTCVCAYARGTSVRACAPTHLCTCAHVHAHVRVSGVWVHRASGCWFAWEEREAREERRGKEAHSQPRRSPPHCATTAHFPPIVGFPLLCMEQILTE